MSDRTVTIETLIKQINMNGGKVAPLTAAAFQKIFTKIQCLENAVQSEPFKKACYELHMAGNDFERLRKEMREIGVVTQKELRQAEMRGMMFSCALFLILLAGWVGVNL